MATSNEKDGSLGSSIAAPRPHVARELDEKRRAALSQVDNAQFSSVKLHISLFDIVLTLTLSIVLSWFHVKVCCVAGVGFFTDA